MSLSCWRGLFFGSWWFLFPIRISLIRWMRDAMVKLERLLFWHLGLLLCWFWCLICLWDWLCCPADFRFPLAASYYSFSLSTGVLPKLAFQYAYMSNAKMLASHSIACPWFTVLDLCSTGMPLLWCPFLSRWAFPRPEQPICLYLLIPFNFQRDSLGQFSIYLFGLIAWGLIFLLSCWNSSYKLQLQ